MRNTSLPSPTNSSRKDPCAIFRSHPRNASPCSPNWAWKQPKTSSQASLRNCDKGSLSASRTANLNTRSTTSSSRERARGARGYACFLGAGAYSHFRPVVVDSLATRGEFLTAYTPYQAEISQGILTSIFEFQTMVAQLTGMDVANASMYDGSTAVPEAGMMAARITRRQRLLVARSVHPEYRQVLETYYRHQRLPTATVNCDPRTGQLDLDHLEASLSDDVAAVIVQSPNFFGIVEHIGEAAELAHRYGAPCS